MTMILFPIGKNQPISKHYFIQIPSVLYDAALQEKHVSGGLDAWVYAFKRGWTTKLNQMLDYIEDVYGLTTNFWNGAIRRIHPID